MTLYRHNTRSITAANHAAEDAAQVPTTKATSGSYFYDTIIWGFFYFVFVFYFCFYIKSNFLFLQGHERERGGKGGREGQKQRWSWTRS